MNRALANLKRAFHGEVITSQHDAFDQARRVYNGMIDMRPAAILRCANKADVQVAVLTAREWEVPIAVRGGGHSVAGLSTIDDGWIVDLSEMTAVRIDEAARIASVGPGATWGRLDPVAARHGLATTGGIIPDTGIAGLTLGGGLGWLMGIFGLACDNLISAEIVTADGQVREVSTESHGDLLWALRGGAGNFGVVTRFDLQLHELRSVHSGSARFPLDSGITALDEFGEFASECPDWLTLSPSITYRETAGPTINIDVCAANTPGGATQSDLRWLHANYPVREMPYPQWQNELRDPYRRGRRSYWKSLSQTHSRPQSHDA